MKKKAANNKKRSFKESEETLVIKETEVIKKSKEMSKDESKSVIQSNLSGFFGITSQPSLKIRGQAKYEDFPSPKVSIWHWNVNGINAILEKGSLQDFFKKEDPMILCLNEIKVDEEKLEKSGFCNKIPKDYEQYWNCCKVKKGYSGTAIFTKVKPISVEYDLKLAKHDGEGRVITAEFKEFIIVATYVPNSGRDLSRLKYRTQEWDADFHDYLEKLRLNKQKPLILTGDLNVAHNPIDVYDPKGKDKIAAYTPEERESFGKFLERGFIDTFRYLYPEKQEFSYYSPLINARASNKGWRIDYFVVYKSDIDIVEDSSIHFVYSGSDHVPIQLKINLDLIRKDDDGKEEVKVQDAKSKNMKDSEQLNGSESNAFEQLNLNEIQEILKEESAINLLKDQYSFKSAKSNRQSKSQSRVESQKIAKSTDIVNSIEDDS